MTSPVATLACTFRSLWCNNVTACAELILAPHICAFYSIFNRIKFYKARKKIVMFHRNTLLVEILFGVTTFHRDASCLHDTTKRSNRTLITISFLISTYKMLLWSIWNLNNCCEELPTVQSWCRYSSAQAPQISIIISQFATHNFTWKITLFFVRNHLDFR